MAAEYGNATWMPPGTQAEGVARAHLVTQASSIQSILRDYQSAAGQPHHPVTPFDLHVTAGRRVTWQQGDLLSRIVGMVVTSPDRGFQVFVYSVLRRHGAPDGGMYALMAIVVKEVRMTAAGPQARVSHVESYAYNLVRALLTGRWVWRMGNVDIRVPPEFPLDVFSQAWFSRDIARAIHSNLMHWQAIRAEAAAAAQAAQAIPVASLGDTPMLPPAAGRAR